MRQKIVCLLLMVMFFLSLSIMGDANADSPYDHLVEFIPTNQAYIRSNGTIEPLNLPIERLGNFYSLKDNIVNYTIEIQKNDIVFDGNGFTISFPSSVGFWGPPGIWANPLISVRDSNKVVIQNTQFRNYPLGISVNNSSAITILGNNFTMGSTGVSLRLSSNCDILSNNFTDNSVCGIGTIDSTYLNVAYNNISRNSDGCSFKGLTYSNITRNNIFDSEGPYGSYNGIWAVAIANNRFFENNFINNPTAICIQGDSTFNNLIYQNYFFGNRQKILNSSQDDISGINDSPLKSAVSVNSNIQLFQPTAHASPSTDRNSNTGFVDFWLLISVILTIVIILSLLLFRRHRKTANLSQ